MKYLPFVLLVFAYAVPSHGDQIDCTPTALSNAAHRVQILQEQLKHVQVGEMDTAVPAPAREQLGQLKDALADAGDAALSCAPPTIDPKQLQRNIAEALGANPPEPPNNTVISKEDHRFDEALGSYGHNLRVQVTRPQNNGFVELDFAINIECGNDHLLLIYELQRGSWRRLIRWQAPPLKEVSDAFGDFFLSAVLSKSEQGDSAPRVVVVHGRPWCTSRFSAFDIDVLSPTASSSSPKVVWHTERGYSRGDFEPSLKTTGNTFEFRINESCMDTDAFERRVVYHYRVENDRIERLQPIAINAREFVEEWLSAPWSESKLFSAQDSTNALKAVHDRFKSSTKDEREYFSHTYGPVRACRASGTYQAQIDSTLERVVPGKPGGESKPQPPYYFLMRDIKVGYLMLSASTQADPTCSGPNLMAAPK